MDMKKEIIFLLYVIFFTSIVSSAYSGDTSVSITSDNATCFRTDMVSYWADSYSNIIEVVFNKSNATDGGMLGNATKYSSDGEACCPRGYILTSNKCVFSPLETPSCSTLKTKESCESISPLIAYDWINNEFDVNGKCGVTSDSYYNATGALCSNSTMCNCEWKEGKCVDLLFTDKFCIEDDGPTITSSCYWTQESMENKCEDEGKIILKFKATLESGNNPDCTDRDVVYECAVSTKLPFFGVFELVISSIIVGIVYFLYRRH